LGYLQCRLDFLAVNLRSILNASSNCLRLVNGAGQSPKDDGFDRDP
jgi:hypothetical protein